MAKFESVGVEEMHLLTQIEFQRGIKSDSNDPYAAPVIVDEASCIVGYGEEAKELLGAAAAGFVDTTHVMKFMLGRELLPTDIPDDLDGGLPVQVAI
jgi:hypothetical protein